jgi:hypothetical protein
VDERKVDRIVENRSARKRNPIWIALGIAVAFIVLAIGGSFFTSHKMNMAADQTNSSAGRPGDPPPNTVDEQSTESARGPSTTGSKTQGAVPPASR